MFNLFRQKHEPTIVCALPEGAALPSFLREAWEYEGKVAEIESQQLKVDQPSHHALIRQNGYYIFTRFDDRAPGESRRPILLRNDVTRVDAADRPSFRFSMAKASNRRLERHLSSILSGPVR